MLDVILKSFDNPDETRLFAKGKFEIVQIGGMTVGRATYEPGWKWSTARWSVIWHVFVRCQNT